MEKQILLNNMLTKERLTKEIEAVKETIKKLKQIELDSISGVEINNIVLKGFEYALIHYNKRD